MSALHDMLKARLAMVRQDLDQVIARLTDADMTWAPKDGMRTIGGPSPIFLCRTFTRRLMPSASVNATSTNESSMA